MHMNAHTSTLLRGAPGFYFLKIIFVPLLNKFNCYSCDPVNTIIMVEKKN